MCGGFERVTDHVAGFHAGIKFKAGESHQPRSQAAASLIFFGDRS